MKYIIASLLGLISTCLGDTITQMALDNPNLSYLVEALAANGLVDMFNNTDMNYTVFAPTNAAFMAAGFPSGSVVDVQILQAHVAMGIVLSGDLNINDELQTIATNVMGYTYNLTYSGTLQLTDPAGLTVTINDTSLDLVADNGVIHVVNEVIMPGNLIDLLVDGIPGMGFTFNTLASVATSAVATALSSPGTLTLFAPVDAAFGYIDSGVLSLLTDPTNSDILQDILLFHTAGAVVFSQTVIDGSPFEVPTQNSRMSNFTIKANTTSNMVYVYDAIMYRDPMCQIIGTDYRRGNGVLHVLNCVITDQTIVDVILENNLDALAGAATTANLVTELQKQGPYTLFGPTDAAFTAAAPVTSLLSTEELAAVLLYHTIVGAGVPAAAALNFNMEMVTTATGLNLTVSGNGVDTVMIYDGVRNVRTVTTPNLFALNGIVHVIDGVLVPIVNVQTALLAKELTSLLGATIINDGLSDYFDGSMNGGITVLAPTNTALIGPAIALQNIAGRLAIDVLTYHISTGIFLSSGLPSMINSNNFKNIDVDTSNGVVFDGIASSASPVAGELDIVCTDGVIHVIDNVLLPFNISALMDITTTAVGEPDFSTLVFALTNASLATALMDDNNMLGFTVFAPPNTAFDALPDGVLGSLLMDVNALTSVLLGHVINGTYLAIDVLALNGATITTLAGTQLTISIGVGPSVMLYDEAMNVYNIIQTDILCTNGVVHIIDRVIADVYPESTTTMMETTEAPTGKGNGSSCLLCIIISFISMLFFIN